MSGVGCIVKEIRHAHGIAEAAIAEATPMRGQVESRVASLVVQAQMSMAQIVGTLSERVKEVAAHSKVQALRVADVITQKLDKGLKAVATSIAATSK